MKKKIGKWEIQVEATRFIGRDLIKEMERFLNEEWKQVVLGEVSQLWWSPKNLGIPSPLVRIDMAPTTEPRAIKTSIYEVEVRPAGLGVMLSLASKKTGQWREVFLRSQCQGFINIETSIQDDRVAAEILGIPYYEEIPNPLGGPYWIRTNLRVGEISKLESVSLGPIKLDGDKTYLVKLGLAERLNHRGDNLDWSLPFVVKPLVGTRMEGAEIYVPGSRPKGVSTKSRILRILSSGKGPYIIQKFISPQPEEMDGQDGWTIWRIFFGWLQGSYRFLGGLWNWRPNLRIHGASDAIFGIIEAQ